MNPEKKLDNLFDKARNEAPKLSFEDVTDKFNASVSLSAKAMLKTWLIKNMTLNTISMFMAGSMLLISAVFVVSYETKSAQYQPIQWGDSSRVDKQKQTNLQATQDKEMEVYGDKAKTNPVEIGDSLEQESDNQKLEANLVKNHTPSDTSPEETSIKLIDTQQSPKFSTQKLPFEDLDIKAVELPKEILSKEPEPGTSTEKSKALLPGKEMTLIIRKEDTEEDVRHFLAALESQGFDLRKSKYNHKLGTLNHIFIWFKHSKGLNFKLKGHDFQQLEIKVFDDEKGNLKHFIYSFNQEEFSKEIPLICKGYKTHMYGKGFQGVSGRTNINISNK